ncbi:peroxisomal multifunctional enzyme [Cavenderia fasciculata]|uniref:Peroxisomal multifunctional enzyme n=1 Tax=Cavenderia fasciculata TaxID=261658 RepID=F4PRB8_CACFS|nr:peroxisomal multifunctional enzyme [Cavenderia fasciculata]EGG22112.1 peroxisomal multifunctional enzyme [Cavenderia fasciculata]|eukprot:XP_004359963.1 peroxisomal multifunctional enzyme [Cavenderia fasciculata]
MSSELLFTDRVVIITGAGGGLGRVYALEFAKRGAKVVVNDLGTSSSGEGNNAKAADKVVNEIKAAGGQAVANYDSVEDGEKIAQTALNAFGRIDIVINNAGILRDVSFGKMTDQDWDLVYRVHVKGAYKLTRACWNHMRDNKYGRIIMTSSAAGLYGNFGQANYSSMKLALVGLSNTLSQEGKARNINVNAIAPVAGSRMTESVMPPEILQMMKPEFVVPLVLYLCHESTTESGSIFEVGAGWVSKVRFQRSAGVHNGNITPESIRDSWSQIESFDNPQYPTNATESVSGILSAVNNKPTTGPVLVKPTKPAASAAAAAAPASVKVDGFKASEIFEQIQRTIATDGAALVKKINGAYQIDIKNDAGKSQSWSIDLKNGNGSITVGPATAKQVTITVGDEDFVQIMTGKLNAQTAFMKSKLKISGNMNLATKLGAIMQKSKL